MTHMQRVPHGLILGSGCERLLHWLERYPFQRAQDLVVALAPWMKRTTVYEHLAEMEQLGLIEILRAGIAQGKRLYHLSPLGLCVCDHLFSQAHPGDEKKRERWEQPGRAQVVREEREKLVRLLPRLPVFLLLQDVINGLVLNAATALTNQGRRANMVRWNWQRDYGHRFTAAHEQVFQLRVEGAITLCLHFPPVNQPPPGSPSLEEHWYTVLLLHCPLDETRLLRTRLDRLLRWRESAERTALYSQMPPLLILATTERQAEWWHQAAIQVAARLRVDRPLGALACLPSTPRERANGWHWSWHRLGTKESCHVQDVLRPLCAPTVPELLVGRGTASASNRTGNQGRLVTLPPRLHARAFALAAPLPSERKAPVRTGSRDDRLASMHLTPRHWEMLRLIFAHPFLACEDLVPLLALSPTTIQLVLADLKRAGYLLAVATAVGERWHLAESGLRLLARLALCHVQRLVRLPVEEGKPLQQRGACGLLQQIRHTAGVYGFFAQLAGELATLPASRLRWWETGVMSEHHFQYREKTYRFRPDALAAVQLGERQVRFWLEWDRGTMTRQDLRIKFATYAMYLTSREWARHAPSLPALLCVAPEIGQERHLTRAALHCLVQVPAAFRVYTTTASLLAVQGLLAPIWQQVILSDQQMQHASPDARSRLALFVAQEGSAGEAYLSN